MPKKGGKGGKDDKGKGKGKGKDEPPDVSVQVCRVSWCCAWGAPRADWPLQACLAAQYSPLTRVGTPACR